jgi:hypothetical protein
VRANYKNDRFGGPCLHSLIRFATNLTTF